MYKRGKQDFVINITIIRHESSYVNHEYAFIAAFSLYFLWVLLCIAVGSYDVHNGALSQKDQHHIELIESKDLFHQLMPAWCNNAWKTWHPFVHLYCFLLDLPQNRRDFNPLTRGYRKSKIIWFQGVTIPCLYFLKYIGEIILMEYFLLRNGL